MNEAMFDKPVSAGEMALKILMKQKEQGGQYMTDRGENMANEVSIYDPWTMGRVVTKLPPVHTFFRSTFFKNEETFVTKEVDVDFVKGSRKVAPYVHPVISGKTVPDEGYETKSYKLPLVAPLPIDV